MKKTIIFFGLLFMILGSVSCKQSPSVQKVKLSEVVRSVFYAPQYVAISQGFFKESGIEIELSTAWGADKGAAALVSGSVDIGFFGPEAAVYVYNRGARNHLVAFAQLTKGDGSFLMARKPMPDFQWSDVKGKAVIGGRKGGVPQMVMEYVLRKQGIDPHNDLNMIQNIQFTATAGAFKSGTGDFIQLFEPTVSVLEKEGVGYVVASFRVAGGVVPYTVYHARADFLKKHPDLIERFTQAIYKGQIWVQNHSAEEIAEAIQSFFPDIEMDILIRAMRRYQSQDTWAQNPIMTKAAFNHLQEIIYDAGELQKKVPYDKMVNTRFAVKAIQEVQQ